MGCLGAGAPPPPGAALVSMVGRRKLWESDLAGNKFVGVVSFCVVALGVYFFRLLLFPCRRFTRRSPLTLFANSRNFEAQLCSADSIAVAVVVVARVVVGHHAHAGRGRGEQRDSKNIPVSRRKPYMSFIHFTPIKVTLCLHVVEPFDIS